MVLSLAAQMRPLQTNGHNNWNYRHRCVIPEIAFCYDRSGQHLLRASALSAALREIILAQRFDRA